MKHQRGKRILAIVGVILLVGMYVGAFVLSFFQNETAAYLFRLLLGCTMILPVALYIFLILMKRIRPGKSEVVDVLVFHGDHVLKEEDGSEVYFAKELTLGLRRKGYEIVISEPGEGTELCLKGMNKTQYPDKSKILVVDSDQDTIKRIRQLGYGGLVYRNYPDLLESFEQIGIRL